MISTSEIRISVVTRDDQLDDAVRAVHTAFGLDSDRREAVVYGGTGTMSNPVSMRKPTLAVVGATGAVGTVMLRSSRPARTSGARSASSPRRGRPGKLLDVRGEEVEVQALAPEVFDGVDVAMFDVPDEVSAEWAPIAAAKGVVVVDNSGAFRMDPDVPLVVPEVNPDAVRNRPKGIIANPNCTTLTMMDALGALHAEWQPHRARRLVVPGRLRCRAARHRPPPRRARRSSAATASWARGPATSVARSSTSSGPESPFPAPLALNVVPWAGSLKDDGWSSEELKVRNESRKILGIPDLKVSATCVRVPVVTTHSLAVHAVFAAGHRPSRRPVRPSSEAPSVVVLDDPAAGEFPTPADVVGTDPTFVGRLRQALDFPNTLELFVCGDNLRKGAALNTAQIAELVAKELTTA